ncbi:hypothetical protein [Sporolactobacillus putidus]|uniref:DUF8042 domain-containing protein n=1 Tax=Sporolactobacillus putidus TaxID=492735 RepID=A0A917S3K9_9BACL|nr:hypothetical protein [Sporolactobacillus putidus]GGL54500.1 hypothetical protein GCM10007968_18210 [Sporolactobacillus putidus]
MDLMINDQQITLLHPSVNQVVDSINNLLNQDNYYSHMIADGVEIYDDCATYLAGHLADIQTLEVKTKTLMEFIHDNLLLAKDYLDRAIPRVIHLTDRFYKNPSKEDWLAFEELLDGVQWLEKMLTAIDRTNKHPENWGQYTAIFSSLQKVLKNVEEALQSGDTVLIADLVLYEIEPLLKRLSDEIKRTLGVKEQSET